MLEGMGPWNKYHVECGPAALYGNCVWRAGDWHSWNPSVSFDEPEFCFTVVESYARIPAELIRQKVWKYIES